MSKDYYKILGVEKGANAEDIKQAFRKLAHKYHPDKQGGDEAKFKEINEAYQVLGNADKRKQYDQFGATFDQQGGFGGGMNWDDFMKQARQGGGFGNVGFDFGGVDLGDIFGDIFGFGGSGRQSRRKKRGEDIAIDLQLDFKEAVFGASREIKLNRKILCPACNGDGKEPGSNFINCSECGGHGQVTRMQRTFLGTMQTSATCPKCGGVGKIPEKKCKRCAGPASGGGFVNEVQNLKIEIPTGVNNGDTLELPSHGNAGAGGVGSLYVNIFVKQSREFERDGWNIISRKKINAFQAMLGDVVDVETVDGTVELKIPEGTQSGTVFRLRGKGVKHANSRGDQLVEVEVEIPRKLSRKARKALEEIENEL